MKDIGFIGVGTMGCPMASNILRNNYNLSFYDPYVSEENKKKLYNLGAIEKSSIADLCIKNEIIISMLPNGNDVKEISLGKDSIINQSNKDLIFIDMSTILPSDSININKKLNEKNIEMYDAPVGRLVSNAIDGSLLIMVGGNKNSYSKIEKILNCMGSDIIYCGKAGSGSTMKIINNYMSIVSNIVTAETLSLVDKSGINRELAIKLMSSTAAGKGHMNLTYPAKVFKNDVGPGFKNSLALKDLKLAINHAEKEGIDLVSGKGVLKTYEAAVEGKYKDLDWTAMFNYIKEINHLD